MADTTLFGVMWLSFKYDKVKKILKLGFSTGKYIHLFYLL